MFLRGGIIPCETSSRLQLWINVYRKGFIWISGNPQAMVVIVQIVNKLEGRLNRKEITG